MRICALAQELTQRASGSARASADAGAGVNIAAMAASNEDKLSLKLVNRSPLRHRMVAVTITESIEKL